MYIAVVESWQSSCSLSSAWGSVPHPMSSDSGDWLPTHQSFKLVTGLPSHLSLRAIVLGIPLNNELLMIARWPQLLLSAPMVVVTDCLIPTADCPPWCCRDLPWWFGSKPPRVDRQSRVAEVLPYYFPLPVAHIGLDLGLQGLSLLL